MQVRTDCAGEVWTGSVNLDHHDIFARVQRWARILRDRVHTCLILSGTDRAVSQAGTYTEVSSSKQIMRVISDAFWSPVRRARVLCMGACDVQKTIGYSA